MAIDVESLLFEVSPEAPCGEDLSYDAAFLALEDMVRTKSAGGVVEGAEEAIEEPNWREVGDKSLELFQRSKDLRVALYLTLGLLKTEGLGGLRDGLAVLRGLLERFWDNLYPKLDPDDNNDPLERINILQSLSPATVSEQDPMKFKQRLAEVPLCNSAQMGRFSLRDIQVAKGEITLAEGEGAGIPDASVIDAAFQDTATDELLASSQAAGEAIEHLTNITAAFSKSAAQGQTPDLSGFQSVLGNIHKCVQGYLAKRGYGDAVEETAPKSTEKGGVSLSGEIRSPQEALLAIEKVCQYFDRHEPSSPVPLLLRRARKLVSKNFLDVIRDVCPDAISQIEMLGGVSSSEYDSSSDYDSSESEG
ncbi:MAG: type VI secretion system protein TssA [Phycisphaerae bacterium]|nr:type VI secretion system protein TssA [Phycisphaerae bacterium]NIU11186.1 type VI secretion system protein TssA [Phycisphaerae bacterium]NIU59042.1 type VI secretion system protein TssA [Phycisphaerae bacterium]NIW95360.1 type VI secretion system protein TssA [Phycisphaerae bacterium]